ncbi:MAG: hypothetical protein R2716_02395 [Microthrixaceae bacterium]
MRDLGAEGVPVELDGRVQVAHGNGYMVDLGQQHDRSLPKSRDAW